MRILSLAVVIPCMFVLCSCTSTDVKKSPASQTPQLTSESILKEAAQGNVDNVRYILDHDPNLVHVKDKNGVTPLHLASGLGYSYSFLMKYDAVVDLLISRGADVNACTEGGMTALHLACSYRIPTRSNWNIQVNGKPLPQHTRETLHRIAGYLIAAGANVNAVGTFGTTPLHLAAAMGHDDLVKLLVANGADSTLTTNDGDTAADIAKRKGHETIVQFLGTQ
jgi:ankyrin repeat protein